MMSLQARECRPIPISEFVMQLSIYGMFTVYQYSWPFRGVECIFISHYCYLFTSFYQVLCISNAALAPSAVVFLLR
jgi:hypothetical protein